MFAVDTVLALSFMGILVSGWRYQHHHKRIFNGQFAKLGQFPFMVGLEQDGWLHCGGGLISPSWILTAAHCIIFSAQHYNVRVGIVNRNGLGDKQTASFVAVHDDPADHDIALVKVPQPFKLNEYVQPIKMPRMNYETPPETNVIAMGFGHIETGAVSMELRYINIRVISEEICREQYANYGFYPDTICAGLPKSGKISCNGDSGSPLVENDMIIGVLSFGPPSCSLDYTEYRGYVQVSHFVDWIEEQMTSNN